MLRRVGNLALERLQASSHNIGFAEAKLAGEPLEPPVLRTVQVNLHGLADAFPARIMRVCHDIMLLVHEQRGKLSGARHPNCMTTSDCSICLMSRALGSHLQPAPTIAAAAGAMRGSLRRPIFSAMPSRRDAVRSLAGFAALPLLGNLGVDEMVEVGRRAHALADRRRLRPPRALTAAEYEIVSQAAERIIPRTTTPGAIDARVADFIDVMLADWYNAAERERFKAGLSELDVRARKLASRGFVQTTMTQQTKLLETLDRELRARRESGLADVNDHWFAMLKHLVVWGYYTSRPGIEKELRVHLMPGRYDGNAPY